MGHQASRSVYDGTIDTAELAWQPVLDNPAILAA